MRRSTLLLVALFFSASWAWAQTARVVYPVRVGESRPLSELAKEFQAGSLHKTSAGDHEIPNRPPNFVSPPDDGRIDPVWQRGQGEQTNAPLVLIEGVSSDDNSASLGFRVMPPDVNGDVGLSHVVETVNLLYRVWTKSGTPLIAPTPTNLLWSGFGGDCEFNNDGDPVVFYDAINDRWVISQFVFSVSQCIACSKTGDPTGAYWLYEYSTPGNDYPKMSNMPGAYYGTIRNFSAGFAMDAHAWNGAKMRTGDPTAEMIVRTMTGVTNIDGVQPADLDGPPPASSPGIFVGHDDASDRLYTYQMVPDFATPGNTAFTGPAFISVPAYSSAFAGGFFGTSIPQPGTTQKLDVLAPFTKFSSHFRDFGTHQTLIVDHSVDINDFTDHAGVRWYELRKVGAGAWTLFQSGSYAPDAHHRWMSNAAMDKNGAIALGYSVSSGTLSPSVRYTGRTASDPLGQMTLAEGIIAAGTGSQLGGSRWGDYSRMTVDPADDETFWYFGEYVQQTGSFEWNTKIGSFKLVSTPTPPTITSTPNTSAVVGLAYSYDADNTVNVTGTAPITFSFTGPSGFNVDANTGVVTWTPTATGSFPVSITATNAQGFDTQNFTINVGTYAARLNAGGANFTDGGGNLYVADQAYTAGSFGFIGGATSTFTNSIGGTTDDVLYQSIRRTSTITSFSYRFDVPNGNFAVTLHLMAPAAGTGSFIMDVSAEGSLVFNDLNINTEAGGTFQALVKTFNATVSDGTLNLDFVRVNKQALVCGIAVVQQTGTPAPEISVSPSSVNFGNVTVGQNADQTVTINNLGTANLTVSSLNVTNSVFTLVSPPAVPFNVTPGGSQALTVRFSPVATGAQSGNLAIASNDADEPTVNVALSGTGVTTPPYTARINAGGPNFTTGGGTLFVADQAYNPPGIPFGFVGGVAATNGSAIANTTDDPLYQAFRRSATTPGASFQYNFNVPSGTYSVTLHLAAPSGGGTGNFVMTVQAEGANVPTLTNFDVNAQAGGTNTALTVSFSQVVTDGTLNLNFVRVNKSSIVSGIEVVQTAAPNLTKELAAAEAAKLSRVPAEFQLSQNYPNPFNPTTRIHYALPKGAHVTLKIYNLKGDEVRTLVEGYRAAGNYEVEWNALNNSGKHVASGVYLYRLEGEGVNDVKRMVLLQ